MTVSQSLKRRRTFSQFLDISTTPILITHTHLQWHDFHRTFYQQTAGYPRSKKPVGPLHACMRAFILPRPLLTRR